MLKALHSLCGHRLYHEPDRIISQWVLFAELFSTASSPSVTSLLVLLQHPHNDFELNTSSE